MSPDRAAAAASLEHARTQMTEAVSLLDQRRLVQDAKAEARAELLDGEGTASHRTRIDGACRVSRELLAHARAANPSTPV